jgi:transposase-like protein
MGEEHRPPPQRTRRGFTKEFKRDAVELVRSTGRPIAEIARELGIYDSTLGNWVRQDRIERGVRQPSPHSEASSSVNNLYGQYTGDLRPPPRSGRPAVPKGRPGWLELKMRLDLLSVC